MTIRQYRHVFHNASSLFIPGAWHGLATSHLLVRIHVSRDDLHDWQPLYQFELRIDPITYDVAIDFVTTTLTPHSRVPCEEWLPPQSGYVTLCAA